MVLIPGHDRSYIRLSTIPQRCCNWTRTWNVAWYGLYSWQWSAGRAAPHVSGTPKARWKY